MRKSRAGLLRSLTGIVLSMSMAGAAHGTPILTGAPWQGTWAQGLSGGSEDMVITSQVASGADFAIDGYFDWLCEQPPALVCSGRELFSGVFTTATRTLVVTGHTHVNAVNLAFGTYTAVLSGDGTTFDGTYSFPGSTVQVGQWTVTRDAPEPLTAALLLAGIGALAYGRRARR